MKVTVDGIIFEMQKQGGISRVFREILPRMCEQSAELQIDLYAQSHMSSRLPIHPQIQAHYFPYYEKFLLPGRLFNRLRNAIREKNLEGKLSKNLYTGIWHSTYYTKAPKNWLGPQLVLCHDMIHEFYQQDFFRGSNNTLFRKQKRECIFSSDIILSNSQTTADDLCSYYGISSDRVIVTPLGYDADCFRPISTEKVGRSFFLYVGQRASYKNFSTLLTAYQKWPKRNDYDLVVVGSEFSRDEKDQLRNFKLSQNVVSAGSVSDQQLALLYNQAVALIYPSLYEGFGIPLLEAMACGCPIIASDIPSTREVAGTVPLYFPPTNPNALIEALSQAIMQTYDPQQGFHRAKEYSWDITAQKTLAGYYALPYPC